MSPAVITWPTGEVSFIDGALPVAVNGTLGGVVWSPSEVLGMVWLTDHVVPLTAAEEVAVPSTLSAPADEHGRVLAGRRLLRG